MKFRECILHIGTEKTGTTSLRSFLAINREKLLANGIFVPRSLSPYAKLANHERITTFALDIRKVRDDLRIAANVTTEDAVNQHRIAVIEGLEREILSIPTTDHLLLLSNEHCHSRLVELDEVLRLKEFLSRYARKQTVVVYLRPQHELAASLYDQALRAGYYDVPLPPVFGPDVREWVNRKYFDYGDLIKRWTHVFSKENIIVRIYSEKDLIGGDTAIDLMSQTGCDVSGFERPPRENTSLGIDYQPVLNVINRISAEKSLRIDAKIRRSIADHLQKLSKLPSRKLSRPEAQRFMEMFKESNEEIRRSFFPDRGALFELDFDTLPDEPSAPTADEELLTKAIIDLVKTL